MRKLTLIAIAIWIGLVSLAAQDSVPTEIVKRTLHIKFGNEAGTAFKLDSQGKIYLVTARHVVTGVPETNATIQVWQADQWKDYHTVRTFFPSSSDADIAIFETEEKISGSYKVRADEPIGAVLLGQKVWFLGFPFWGLGSRFPVGMRTAAFIKSGTMSAIDAMNPDAVVLYIDGFNNPGFSGGPIVYWDHYARAYRILGVVHGYKEDTAKILINGQHVDTSLLVNSGILVAYSTRHALKAIKALEESQKHPQTP